MNCLVARFYMTTGLSKVSENTTGLILSFFTACSSSCGKVMFSQACVKNSVHRGVHPLGRHPSWAETPPGRHLPSQTLPRQAYTPLPGMATKRAVHILLECILGLNNFTHFFFYFKATI